MYLMHSGAVKVFKFIMSLACVSFCCLWTDSYTAPFDLAGLIAMMNESTQEESHGHFIDVH